VTDFSNVLPGYLYSPPPVSPPSPFYAFSEGQEIWITAETAYNERVARVENQIIARLRDRLGTARNANEMFRVFSKFNALFVRPKVRSLRGIGIKQWADCITDSWCHPRVSNTAY
jgi:hypothetical protein